MIARPPRLACWLLSRATPDRSISDAINMNIGTDTRTYSFMNE